MDIAYSAGNLEKHIAVLAYAVDNGDGTWTAKLVSDADPLPGSGGGGGSIGDVTVTIADMGEVGGNDSVSTTLFTQTDTTGYSSVSIYLNIASGTTLVAEVSDDGTNWRAIYGESEDTNAQSNSFTASGIYAFAARAKQFRVRRTVLGSGTSSAVAKFRKDPFIPRNVNIGPISVTGTADVSGSTVAASQSGAWAVSLTGTPAVTISGTPSVALSGTPNVNAIQSGSWSVSLIGAPTVDAVQSGAWSVGITGSVDVSGSTVAASQSGAWAVSLTGTPTVSASQSGSWSVSVTGTAAVTQSGSWNVGQSGNWNMRLQDGGGTAITSTGAALDVNIKTAANLNASIIRTPRANKGRQVTTITGTAETDITPLGGSGNYLDLFRLVIANQGATDVNVTIRDDSGGTAQMPYAVKAGQTVGFSGNETSDQTGTNKKWTAQSSAATTLVITAEWIKNT